MIVQSFSIDLVADIAATVSATLIASDGTTHLFYPQYQLDSFVDPQGDFIQRCYLCASPTLPNFTVFYRPDENSSREEWIFEYGNPWYTPISDMPGYQVTITKRDGTTETISVPEHYWFSRWRWQSSVRPVRFTMYDLMSVNLIPTLVATNLCKGPLYNMGNYTPMSTCGIPADQGQTGIYPGIGLITGWQAQYATRPGVSENFFRNQAEASGSFQQHVRDPNTLAPFNWVIEYSNANMYSASTGQPYFSWTRRTKTDTGHHPSLTYVPYLLTGDPYYLEEQQFLTNHLALLAPGNGGRWSDKGRYFAWPLRTIAQTYLITPDIVPSWLMPKSYFIPMLDKNKEMAMKHVNDTSSNPWNYVFHDMPDTGQSSTKDPANTGSHVWQSNYTGLTLAWMVSAGFEDWRIVAEWLIKNLVDRASSSSGYARAYPSPYHIRYNNASALAVAMTTTDDTIQLQYKDTFASGESVTIDGEAMILIDTVDGLTWGVSRTAPKAHSINAYVYGKKHTSWQQMMAGNKMVYPEKWTQADNLNVFAQPVGDLTYPSNHRAALMQAQNAGLLVSGLDDASSWMDTEVRKYSSSNSPRVEDNWAVVRTTATQRKPKIRR